MKVSKDDNKGLINSIQLVKKSFAGDELIFPWSIEFGDPASFFSLEQPGWRTVKRNKDISVEEDGVEGNLDFEISGGYGELAWRDSIKDLKVSRHARLIANSNLQLMDFVIQYRFRSDIFQTAEVDGKIYTHQNKNLYIQSPVQDITLRGEKGITVKIRTNASSHPNGFDQEMYARDRGNMWIVHSRLMAKRPDLETIKLNVPWYNKAIPTRISKLLFLVPGLKQYLWYRGELKGYPLWNLPLRFLKPSAYVFTDVAEGQTLMLDTEAEFLLE